MGCGQQVDRTIMGIVFDKLIKKIDKVDHPDQLTYDVVGTLMHNAINTMIQYYHEEEISLRKSCDKFEDELREVENDLRRAFDKVEEDIFERLREAEAVMFDE